MLSLIILNLSEVSEKVFKSNLIDWGGGVEKPSSGYQ